MDTVKNLVDERAESLMKFLDRSVCNVWAVDTVTRCLEENGFQPLAMSDEWRLEPGKGYYVVKNHTAVMAFIVGQDPTLGYKIIAAHSDSPGFRIKPHPEMVGDGNVLRLNTEVYGGPILYTWFDRPLSIAGKVVLRGDDPLSPRVELVRIERPVLTIPHLAIHYNRQVNDGNKLSKQKDMLPVMGILKDKIEKDDFVLKLIARELGVEPSQILDCDLMLYDTTPACRVGADGEFMTSGRIDDLSMVHAALTALTGTTRRGGNGMTRVMAIFDNEETGSGTKQGAGSPLLYNVLKRVNASLGGTEESFIRAIDRSFMVSADNAHGTHPNYVDKQDPTNHPVLGGGPVIKINANCKYMTDAETSAVFASVCEKAGVPCQYFVNHSDVAGGSTLGNILTSQIELRGVDMGAAQWAMHSCRETSSVVDHAYIIKAFTTFYDL